MYLLSFHSLNPLSLKDFLTLLQRIDQTKHRFETIEDFLQLETLQSCYYKIKLLNIYCMS